jgi:polyamine oxidase
MALCAVVASALALLRSAAETGPLANDGAGADAAKLKPDRQVLILGGGVSGILAARKLTEDGITNFLIIEARDELGGRMRSTSFGAPGN